MKLIIAAFLTIQFVAFTAGVPNKATASPAVPENCLVQSASDQFDSLDMAKWSLANELDGGGNWCVPSFRVLKRKDGKLHILPTLTADHLGEAAVVGNTPEGRYVLTIPAGKCTGRGGYIINPIMSGKLMSRFTLKPGVRVEVKAKIPQGDWIWPAIWLLPRYKVYGEWPLSGEIDIMESRGNMNAPNGANTVGSTLHWGLSYKENRYPMTHATIQKPQGTFADDFHTYTVDWTSKGITMYTDGQVVFTIDFSKIGGFWKYGEFKTGTNPWGDSLSAPFDREFFLIMNVAVGGTGAYFRDDMPGKPWKNYDNNAMGNFWAAKNQWLPTWPSGGSINKRAMIVDHMKTVKIDDNGTPICQ
ncbi:concanavalin A-like lectin/glucanase domain-containing protein [Paraphysoderma sedebokerense]|nr:concanavalin A-like lectin/glucanase domain-containing protein [Paraphysoderma sedebokerense]